MAIDRLRSPYANQVPVGRSDIGPAAYASSWTSLIEPYTFIGDGTVGTVNGVVYRCHRFEYDALQSYNITFSRAGVVDVIVCAGGGGGGGAYFPGNHAGDGWFGGGGGSGGLIISYNHGVSATTYSISVGNKGAGNYGSNGSGVDGGNSVFGSLTAIGGGGGGTGWSSNVGRTGGSGGGYGGGGQVPVGAVANGTSGQGNSGGTRSYTSAGGGGGGGYLEPGEAGTPVNGADSRRYGGKGGDGIFLRFDGQTRSFSAGGGGSCYSSGDNGLGGAGGGGNGGRSNSGIAGANATNFGCGGGGGAATSSAQNISGGNGSFGLVIVRYALG